MIGWTLVRDALLLLAVAPFAYYVLAIIAAGKFFGRRFRPSDFSPPVSILKPIRGLDREAYENFASFCRQDYPEFEILFCVTDDRDAGDSGHSQIDCRFPRAPDSSVDWFGPAWSERQGQQALPHGPRSAQRNRRRQR